MYPYFNLLGKQIPTYGIFLSAGFLIALLLARQRVKRAKKSTDYLLIIAAVAMGVALLAAKGLYLLVCVPHYTLLQAIKAGDFSILADGGLIFYGGLIGGILVAR